MIDAGKDSGLVPTRKDFDVLTGVDRRIRDGEIGLLRQGLSLAFGARTFAYRWGTDGGDSGVGINASLFFDQANEWNWSPIQEKEIRKEICVSVAHEVAHVYVASRYPRIGSKTDEANDEDDFGGCGGDGPPFILKWA